MPLLGLSRIIYLVLAGGALFVAAPLTTPTTVGAYALLTAYGSIASTILQAGYDRVLLICAGATGQNERPHLPHDYLRVRIASLALLMVGSLLLFPQLRYSSLALGALLATRIVIIDLEAVLIPSQPRRVALATIANGVLTAIGLPIAAATSGLTLMLAASALANAVHLVGLGWAQFKERARHAPLQAHSPTPRALPFWAMSLAAVLYARVDFALLGVFEAATASVAAYALSLRAFDAIVAFRGASVQQLSARWAGMAEGPGIGPVTRASSQALWAATLVALALYAVAVLGRRLDPLPGYEGMWPLLACIGAGTPLVAAHYLSSAFVFSRPASTSTTVKSFGLAALAVLVAVPAVALYGVLGALVARLALEYVSFCVLGAEMTARWGLRDRVKLLSVWPLATAGLASTFLLGWGSLVA